MAKRITRNVALLEISFKSGHRWSDASRA